MLLRNTERQEQQEIRSHRGNKGNKIKFIQKVRSHYLLYYETLKCLNQFITPHSITLVSRPPGLLQITVVTLQMRKPPRSF